MAGPSSDQVVVGHDEIEASSFKGDSTLWMERSDVVHQAFYAESSILGLCQFQTKPIRLKSRTARPPQHAKRAGLGPGPDSSSFATQLRTGEARTQVFDRAADRPG